MKRSSLAAQKPPVYHDSNSHARLQPMATGKMGLGRYWLLGQVTCSLSP